MPKDIPDPETIDVADLTAERSRRRSSSGSGSSSSGTGPRWRPGDEVTTPKAWEPDGIVPDDGTHVPRDEEPVEPRYHNVTDLVDSDGYDEDAIVTCTKYADEESRKVQFQLSEHTVRLVEEMVAQRWIPGIKTPADAYRNAIHHGVRRYVERHEFDNQLAADREHFLKRQEILAKAYFDRSSRADEQELVGILRERVEFYLSRGDRVQARKWLHDAERTVIHVGDQEANDALQKMIKELHQRMDDD